MQKEFQKNGSLDSYTQEMKQAGYTATTNLIVRGWGTYFELDYNYKSVKFNGWGNCGFFLYEKPWFKGKTGKFRGHYTKGMWQDKQWNSKDQDFGSLCRNINMEYFNNRTGSLETNDTCWGNAKRANQTVLPGQTLPGKSGGGQ